MRQVRSRRAAQARRAREDGRDAGAVGAGVVVDRPGNGGEVTSGFTKAEILKPEDKTLEAPAGVFTRVGGLLAELLG